jgi:hypothetical protein
MEHSKLDMEHFLFGKPHFSLEMEHFLLEKGRLLFGMTHFPSKKHTVCLILIQRTGRLLRWTTGNSNFSRSKQLARAVLCFLQKLPRKSRAIESNRGADVFFQRAAKT